MKANVAAYAGGLLTRALEPTTQPPEIRRFLSAEIDLVSALIPEGARLVDFGCGTGRHLAILGNRLRIGVGVDYQCAYVAEARRAASAPRLHYVVADAIAVPIAAAFDFATCLTNTWGTMADKAGVLVEMRRLAPAPQTRLVTVYSEASVPARREWYRRMGHPVVEESSTHLVTAKGFRSEHFSEARLRRLIGDCLIGPLADIAYLVTF